MRRIKMGSGVWKVLIASIISTLNKNQIAKNGNRGDKECGRMN